MNEPSDKSASASDAENTSPEADASHSGPASELPKTAAGREEARLHEPDPSTAIAEAIRRSGGGEEPKKSTRPPAWLIVFTILIPLTIAWMWYQASYMRPMNCEEVGVALQGTSASEHRRALEWAGQNIDEYSQSTQVKGVTRNWDEVQPCVDAILTYSDNTPPDTKLYPDIARALSSLHIIEDEEKKFKAFKWLEDVLDGTSSAGQDEMTRFQAATSLARFGRTYLGEKGVLLVVRRVVLEMIASNSEMLQLNGVYALGMVGNNQNVSQLRELAGKSPFPSVKQAAEDAAIACKDKID